ncbi:MAG: glucosamine-6-phosphate deaminase [Eubacteriales bacterium]|nr:glucosamine-6-phosphate deaminase [Eubacteriales bacterium]
MQIHRYANAQQAGQAAAILIGAQLLRKPDSVLGLATGSSPVPTYQQLIRMFRGGVLNFSAAIAFNLDEYCHLPEDHPCSYHHFMREKFFRYVNFAAGHTHIPNGNAEDLTAECARYDQKIIKAGGIDLQLLGIGRNGHIGFNEPSDQFVYGCHVVKLTQSTIQANRRFFDREEDVPREAVSLGVGSIMNAKSVLLIATGSDKAEAVRKAILEDIDPCTQASILRTHPNVIFLLDEAAASQL